MKDLYLPPLNLETDEDKEWFGRKLRGELPSYNGTANYRLFVSTAVNPNFYSKGQDSNEKRKVAAARRYEIWRSEATKIRETRRDLGKPELSKMDLARKVKENLKSDAANVGIQRIRKVI